MRSTHRPANPRLALACFILSLGACTGLIDELGGPRGSEQNGSASGDGDGAELPDDVTPEQLANGEKLYGELCASCHGGDGQGTPFGAPLTRDLGFDNLVAYIDANMPQGAPDACDEVCSYDVAAYVQKTFVIPAQNGGGGPATCTGETPAPRMLRLLTRREYERTVSDLLGVAAPDTSNVPVEPRVRGFDNNAAASVVTSRHVDEYVSLAEKLAVSALESQRARLVPCDGAQSGCSRQVIERLGLRAFRRPLSSDEIEAYLALFAADLTEGSFDKGVELVVQAMLISPSFLYRAEMGRAQGDGTFALTPYETASALSYTLIGSMPDDELFAAAAEGRLSTTSELEAQARRLLADPRARDQLAEFATQWLRTESLLSTNKDSAIFPGFSDAVRTAMAEEQRRFLTELFFDPDATFDDLFNADYVFVNDALASFYGLPSPGADFARVDAPAASGRGGLLGLGAVMASHAHSNESSPIRRGLFVRDRILCQELPPPPANLDTTPPGLDFSLTTRERFAQHTADENCASCHKFIDGVGFGLEGFDGVGAFRSTENGKPLDTSGTLVGLDSLSGSDTHSFDGPRELAELLAGSDSAQACVARQYYRFARGYREEATSDCSVDRLGKEFREGGLKLNDLLVAPVRLKDFLVRQ
jgi:hypothetical protein